MAAQLETAAAMRVVWRTMALRWAPRTVRMPAVPEVLKTLAADPAPALEAPAASRPLR
jgi:hypothetical protein